MTDVAIIGSGFGGTLLALIARRLGRSVVLLERGSHPRFVIGESSTPMADLIWLELARRYGLSRLVPFAKWGTWRRHYPEIACGLKRGFSFFRQALGEPFAARADRTDQLLVAASPREEIADTHWYRPEFDAFLVGEAIREGVEYVDHCEVTTVNAEPTGVALEAVRGGRSLRFRARWVVDAGNRGGPVVRALGLRERRLPCLPETEALFTHFRGVRRLDDLPLFEGMEAAPYPVDDAAVHHVFPGGWMWVLRFNHGVTSAGVAVTASVSKRFGLAEGAAGWRRVLEALPTVSRQFESARPVEEWVHASSLGFQTGPAAGRSWALLPSSAGFVDPLMSSGFTLNLLGIERLAGALERCWGSEAAWEGAMSEYAVRTAEDLLVLDQHVGAMYRRLGDFEAFTELARLYFCAVIHTETQRRLGRCEAAGGFLLGRNPPFQERATAICREAMEGAPAVQLRAAVDAVLSTYDVGGLEDATRRPWYPVRAEDLRRCRDRVGATADEVEALLAAAGMAGPA